MQFFHDKYISKIQASLNSFEDVFKKPLKEKEREIKQVSSIFILCVENACCESYLIIHIILML